LPFAIEMRAFWLIGRVRGLGFAQVLVHEAYDSRSLANGGCDALDRALAHVPGREDAGHARLERQGISVLVPACAWLLEDISTRHEIALSVTLDLGGT
jgi:hypothetical protein